MIDRIALGKLLPGGKGAIKSWRQLPGAAGRAFVTESGTEAVQEGGIEYAGESIGTQKGYSSNEAVRRAIGGAIVGGPTGAAVRGATASVEVRRDQAAQKIAEDALRAREASAAAGGDALDAANAASESIAGNLKNPIVRDEPMSDIRGLMAQAQQQGDMLTSGANDADIANAAPDLWAPSTAPRPYDIGRMGRNLANPPVDAPAEALSERITDVAQGPEIPAAPGPAQSEAGPQVTESGTGVFRVPVDQINVDAEQYQFRSRVNEQGVDKRLDGVKKWDDGRANNILVHRRVDGSLYVADGHHRLDLAKRLGQTAVNAKIIDEADGVTVEDARFDAAMNNIANDKADALDVAKVFRNSKLPVSEVRKAQDLPNNQAARDGEALAKLSDNAFGMVAAGQLSEKDGAAIGSAFSETGQQEAAASAFQKIEPQTDYQRQLLISEIRAAEFAQSQGDQSGLFGDDAQEVSLMQDRLKVLEKLRQQLNMDKRLFKSLNDNADRAIVAGNKIAVEANATITERSAKALI